MRVLVLGGTSEAMQLAGLLAGDARFDAMFSLAGRTSAPLVPPVPCRIGGFGGAEALGEYLRAGRFAALVDATHPFAAQMSRHAAQACGQLGLPMCLLTRPAWRKSPGDRWIEVGTLEAAAAVLGEQPRRIFLTTGRLGLQAFEAAPQHRYLIRSIDPLQPAPALDHKTLLARPPFTVESEVALMQAESIGILVTKNSGAAATGAKIAAARQLGLPVVMVQRPKPPDVLALCDARAVVEWLERVRG